MESGWGGAWRGKQRGRGPAAAATVAAPRPLPPPRLRSWGAGGRWGLRVPPAGPGSVWGRDSVACTLSWDGLRLHAGRALSAPAGLGGQAGRRAEDGVAGLG